MKKAIAFLLVICLTLTLFPESFSVRALNEALIEETENEILIPIGETKTLDSPLNPVSTFMANLFSVNTVTWTSDNPEIATVDADGVVTGNHVGHTVITATQNGSVLETYAVETVFEDGVYNFQAYDTTGVIGFDTCSIANNFAPEIVEYLGVTNSLDCSLQKWYIERQSSGYYTISPYFYPDVQLQGTTSTTAALYKPNTTNSTRGYWDIDWYDYGYVIRNTYRNSYLSTELDSPGSVYLESLGDGYSNQEWDIYADGQPYGVLIFDTDTGNLLGNSFGETSANHLKEIERATTGTLTQLGIDAVALGSTAEPSVTMVANTSMSYSTYTETYSANKGGKAQLTAAATINGQGYGANFSILVYENVSVINVKDSSFSSTYTQYMDDVIDFLNAVYFENFGIRFSVSGTTQEYEYIDNCTMGTNAGCSSTDCGSLCSTHHKNIRRISDAMFETYATTNNTLVILWTNRNRYAYCTDETGTHEPLDALGVNCWDVINGVEYASPVVQLLQIPDVDSNENAKKAMACILAHEVAHSLHLDEVYKGAYSDISDSTHQGTDDSDQVNCLMSKFNLEKAIRVYDDVINNGGDGFCSACFAKLKNVEIPDNVYEYYSGLDIYSVEDEVVEE